MLALLSTVLIAAWLLRRAWALPATAVAMPFGVLAMDAFNRSGFPVLAQWKVAQALTVVVVFVACARQVARLGPRRALADRAGFLCAAAAYFAYALVAASWSTEPVASAKVWLSFSKYLVVFVLGAHLVVRDEADLGVALREIAWVWTPYLALVLFAGEWGARGVVSAIPADHAWEGFGAGEVGYLALPTLAAACALTLPLLTRCPRWLRALGVVVMLAVVVRSGARGQLVGVCLGAAAYVPSRALGILAAASLRGAALVALGFALAVLLDHAEYPQVLLRWTLAKLETAFEVRFELIGRLWEAYLAGGWSTVVFGLGTAESGVIMGIYPHVIVVEVLCEHGLIGLTLFFWAVLVLVLELRSHLARNGRTSTIAGGVALLVFLAVVGLKSGGVLASPWLWTTAALVARATARDRRGAGARAEA